MSFKWIGEERSFTTDPYRSTIKSIDRVFTYCENVISENKVECLNALQRIF